MVLESEMILKVPLALEASAAQVAQRTLILMHELTMQPEQVVGFDDFIADAANQTWSFVCIHIVTGQLGFSDESLKANCAGMPLVDLLDVGVSRVFVWAVYVAVPAAVFVGGIDVGAVVFSADEGAIWGAKFTQVRHF